MIERLEVSPGPGTTIRYGAVAAWASPSASAGLVSFLAVSARNLAASPTGGRQLADHLAGVLQARDPEPHAAFAVVGPSEDGWTALLHGPVQVWDGRRWTAPERIPGWLHGPLVPAPGLAVTGAGGSAPAVSPDSMWDLEAGVVPGGGFLLIPSRTGVTGPAGAPRTEEEPGARLSAVPAAGPSAAGLAGSGPDPDLPVGEEPGAPEVPDASTVAGGSAEGSGGHAAASGATAGGATSGPATPASVGPVDLRSEQVRSRVVAYPPLPTGGDPGRPGPGSPVVAGVLCRQGHLNRPGMSACVRCAAPITGTDAYNVTGTRPALGCLVLDDGSIYRLDSGYVAGSDPAPDPTVRGGLARPLRLTGSDVAPTHAEIRLHDWDVVLNDRGSSGGTFVYGPDSAAWERLRPYQPRVLAPGTHIAFGQAVVTFLTPWMSGVSPSGRDQPPGAGLGDPAGGTGGTPGLAGQDTRDRYFGQ